MAGEASKSATARTGILVLALVGIFYGMYMLGQAVAAESEATQAKLDGLILQVDELSREVRSLKPRRIPVMPTPKGASRAPLGSPPEAPGVAPAPVFPAPPDPADASAKKKAAALQGAH